ncbi:alpha/beta hydrolase [Mycobacteroides abscessus]|uniref:alpha/beta hydrolase n=1 Tax=Mycobacteroides abscessus TaxID=36809 RepID=UPI000C263DD3|nr:alpha/beta fold hydrolase [Mycobacteroides abscessus]
MSRHVVRFDVDFLSEETRCAAWLYTQSGPPRDTTVPVIVMAHGLGGVRAARLDAFAERFAAQGYACLLFDYRNFGDSDGAVRCLIDIGDQLVDWSNAVSYARALPGVDPDRVVLWGTSLSGGHVINIAARDHRIAAVILQCPFTDGIASSITTRPMAGWRLLRWALRDQLAAWSGALPIRVPVAAAPHETGLLTAPDSASGYRQIFDAAGIEDPELDVPARIALRIPAYRPGLHLGDLRCPVLTCIARHDTATPAKATLRHLRRAPHAQVRMYDIGHFDFYTGQGFEHGIADQIDFLQAQLGPDQP